MKHMLSRCLRYGRGRAGHPKGCPARVVGTPTFAALPTPIDLRSIALLLHDEFRDQAIAFYNALFKIIDSNDQPGRAVVNVS